MAWKRAGKAGRIQYTPTDMRNQQSFIRLLAMQEMAGRAPLDGPIRLRMDFRFEIPASWSRRKQVAAMGAPHVSRPDASNLAKLVEDALNGTAFRDDAQVAELTITKRYGPQALTVVMVEALADGINAKEAA
tara:strand:- start:8220 stop:8615 length:396 start_codon:yes stop_codon:yes gene_type:complete